MDDTRKNIKIEEYVFAELKKHCDENALKISKWVEKIIIEKVNVDKQKVLDEEK